MEVLFKENLHTYDLLCSKLNIFYKLIDCQSLEV